MNARANLATAERQDSAAKGRVAGYDWSRIKSDLNTYGAAPMEKFLTPKECTQVASLYMSEDHFRSHIIMARHGFGKGEYRYFKYPLPNLIAGLRAALYPQLASIANEWSERLGDAARFPDEHDKFLKRCHDLGQTRPTPLLLQYVAGDYNCLHQDLYGDLAFPLQVAILLSEPDKDFTGGEFVLTEQRPRMQSRPEVVNLKRGRRQFIDRDGTVVASDPDAGTAFIRTGLTVHTEEVFEDFKAILVEIKK